QAVLAHFRYRLVAIGSRLATEEGLTTRRRVEIPLRKVQIVRTDEPLLRRFMGYGTVLIETAGLGVTDGRLRQAEGVIPMVEHDELGKLAHLAIPSLDQDPWAIALRPAHRRALVRITVRRMAAGLLVAAGLTALFFPWGALSFGLVPPVGFMVAWLDWKRQGWLVTPTVLISRRGFFNRRTWIVARDKVQSVHVGQTLLMRWYGLAAVVVRAAGSDVSLPDLGRDLALDVLEQLSPATASAQQQLDGQDAADHAHDVGREPRGDGVPDPADADTAEVDRQDVEGRLGRPVHGADQIADVAVGTVGINEFSGDAEGTRARQRTHQGQDQRLGRQPQGGGELADEASDGGQAPALSEHADR
ncbi:MAG: PH domain-containing protein, partial [Oligoflexia bacterium]|nr:PH domain-containing protein [Oligoflexia bacterium]